MEDSVWRKGEEGGWLQSLKYETRTPIQSSPRLKHLTSVKSRFFIGTLKILAEFGNFFLVVLTRRLQGQLRLLRARRSILGKRPYAKISKGD